MSEPVLVIAHLSTHFFTRGGVLKAVDDVSIEVFPGRILGIVGESGSGKSVMALSVLGLVEPPGRVVAGRVLFRGEDLLSLPADRLREIRGRHLAMVFQDAMTALNPVLSIETQVVEAILAHERAPRAAARARAVEALRQVGIPAPEARLKNYPHELSGGMRQRVAIAIALLHRPALVIADEPTTALDVTIQSQILYEAQRLSRELGTALIWITHDLSVVAGLVDEVGVMYAGRLVEFGPVDAVLDRPLHPYTRGLIGSIPSRNRRGQPLAQIQGTTPSLVNLSPGCTFRTRCTHAEDRCEQDPPLSAMPGGRAVRCFFPVLEDDRP